jgi:hypothetical protein
MYIPYTAKYIYDNPAELDLKLKGIWLGDRELPFLLAFFPFSLYPWLRTPSVRCAATLESNRAPILILIDSRNRPRLPPSPGAGVRFREEIRECVWVQVSAPLTSFLHVIFTSPPIRSHLLLHPRRMSLTIRSLTAKPSWLTSPRRLSHADTRSTPRRISTTLHSPSIHAQGAFPSHGEVRC